MAGKDRNPTVKVGFWHMIRDVMVTSINKGQFPIALVGLIILALIFKMPQNDVSQLVFTILSDLKTGHLVGWLLTIGLSIAWFLHAKHQRRLMHGELARVSKERDDCQEKLIGKRLASSKVI